MEVIIALIVFGALGLFLGFVRSILVFAFVLAGWFFLVVLGGGPGLAYFICMKVPVILTDVLGRSTSPFCAPTSSLIMMLTTGGAFLFVCFIGLLVSSRLLPRPNLAERIWGAIPGAAMGYVAVFAFNSFISRSNGNSPFIFSIQPTSPMGYIPIIILIIGGVFVLGVIAWMWVHRHA